MKYLTACLSDYFILWRAHYFLRQTQMVWYFWICLKHSTRAGLGRLESIRSQKEEKGKYLFSEGRKGKVSVLRRKKRESICSQKEEKGNYLFSEGRKGKVSVLMLKRGRASGVLLYLNWRAEEYLEGFRISNLFGGKFAGPCASRKGIWAILWNNAIRLPAQPATCSSTVVLVRVKNKSIMVGTKIKNQPGTYG